MNQKIPTKKLFRVGKPPKYGCGYCKSPQVDQAMWVDMNTGECDLTSEPIFTDDQVSNGVWCRNCKTLTCPIELGAKMMSAREEFLTDHINLFTDNLNKLGIEGDKKYEAITQFEVDVGDLVTTLLEKLTKAQVIAKQIIQLNNDQEASAWADHYFEDPRSLDIGIQEAYDGKGLQSLSDDELKDFINKFVTKLNTKLYEYVVQRRV